jgi:hypothetical protein
MTLPPIGGLDATTRSTIMVHGDGPKGQGISPVPSNGPGQAMRGGLQGRQHSVNSDVRSPQSRTKRNA